MNTLNGYSKSTLTDKYVLTASGGHRPLADSEFIVGTQTAATGSWTGVSIDSELYDGKQISYWLPYNGSGNATLNLTLAGGPTTGDINCYYGGTSRLTTQYSAGNIIRLVYRENVTIGSTTIEKGWWADANYADGNTYTSAWCGTAAATAAKTATCSNYTLRNNSYIHVLIRHTNTAASALTLNINSTGAKPIYINGVVSSSSNYTLSAGTYLVFYNGTNFYFRTDNILPGYIEKALTLSEWSDTRSVATTPNDYNKLFKVLGIKTAGTTLGLTSTLVGNYATIIGWRGWSDSSGGYAWEIASTNKNRLYVRSGATTTWNNGWSALAYISDIPTKTSLLTNDSNFVTGGPYLPLAGGVMNNGAKITFNANGGIIQTTATTSNATELIKWYKGTAKDADYSYSAQIGWHNIGDTDGAIYLVPHPSNTDPWAGSVGLYIGKNTLKWNNNNLLKAIKSITRSGTTVTYTCLDGTTGTFTQLDNNTTYSFSGGVDKFTVTPSSGSAIDVSVGTLLVNGTYTRNGGEQRPSYIESGKVRWNMMRSTTTYFDSSPFSGYCDWMMMDTYTGSDVPYVTMIGVLKYATPHAYIASGAKGDSSGKWTIKTLLDSGNYTTYTVKKDGTGASGTWGINISGSAAIANRLALNGIADSTTYGTYAGIIQTNTGGPESESWHNSLKILHNNSSGYYTQLAQNFTGTHGLWHRSNRAGTISRWYKVIDDLGGTIYGGLSLLSDSGDSPHLVFQRGTTTDGTYDWDMYVTGGYFKMRYNNAGTWSEILSLYPGSNLLEGYQILTAGNSSVSGGGSTWGSSITVNIGGTSKTLTIPTIPNLSLGTTTGSGNAVTSISVSGHTITLNKGTTFLTSQSLADCLRSTAWINNPGQDADAMAANTMGFTYSNNAPHTGSIIYFAGTSGGSYGILLNASYYGKSISFRTRNGDNSTWNSWDRLARAEEIPTKTSQLTNDSGFITSRGYIGTTSVQASSGNLALTGINNITTPLYGFTITTPSGNIQIGPQNTSGCHIYTNRDLFYFNKPIYYWDGSSSHVYISEYNYTSYTPILNSSSTHATKSSVIYAPTTSGSGGDLLISDGLGSAPVWISPGNVTVGGANKADKLTVARTIALSGAVTGSASFNGSANITIATTMGSHTHSTYVQKAGDTMTGSLTLDGGANLYMTTTTSKLQIFAHSDSNYILSGNKGWNGNTPLYITGYNATQGSNLYLNFANIYCRSNGASYVNLDSGNWSTYIDVSKYLPLTGGTLYNSSNMNPLSINSDSGESGIKFLIAYANKGWFGYNASYGVGIYNYTRGKYLNYKDDGTLLFEGNEVLHSGNWSNYITLPTTPSGGYIGTTPVQSIQQTQNLTGIGGITANSTIQTTGSLKGLYVYVNSIYGNTSTGMLISATSSIDLSAGDNALIYISNAMRAIYTTRTTPASLGLSNAPWGALYAASGTFTGNISANGGSFYTNTNGAYHTSDIRKKTNITKARNLGIADLLVEFDWKDSSKHSWGYIAQDLLEVLPEAVDYNEDIDVYSVNYNVAHSAAIASLTARIKELEEKLKKYGIL